LIYLLVKKSDIVFKSIFAKRDLAYFTSEKEAYHHLIHAIVTQQQFSTNLIRSESVKRIFVDGGFSRNSVYMNMLARAFPGMKVFATSMAQASAFRQCFSNS
jgi:sugar (pentulose or hexulose) kinase